MEESGMETRGWIHSGMVKRADKKAGVSVCFFDAVGKKDSDYSDAGYSGFCI